MGGDLGGLGGRSPQNLRWRGRHASAPPSLIFWEVVFVGCAQKHEQSKERCNQGIIFWNRGFSREEGVTYDITCSKDMKNLIKDMKTLKKYGQWLKKVIRNFWAWKWKFFAKKTSFRNLTLRNCFPSPQTRRQVSAYDSTSGRPMPVCW